SEEARFKTEDPLQNAVHEVARKLVIRRTTARYLSDQPCGGDKRVKQGVEVAQKLHLKSTAQEQLLKAALRVAAKMVMSRVVRAPHPGIGRHGQQELAPRLQPA